VNDLPAWSEFDLVDKKLKIGTAVFEVLEPITRCTATMANPKTGERDAETLAALQAGWGHQDFGVAMVVVEAGEVTCGDEMVVLG